MGDMVRFNDREFEEIICALEGTAKENQHISVSLTVLVVYNPVGELDVTILNDVSI